MDDHGAIPEAFIVRPTAQEASEGLARLQACMPYWKETPALLVIKPSLGLIVSVLDYAHDEMGFTLRLKVRERLVAPSEFDCAEYEVGCVWNQPYVSVSSEILSAPYCFYLHFDAEGVNRAREAWKAFSSGRTGGPGGELMLSILRACFVLKLG